MLYHLDVPRLISHPQQIVSGISDINIAKLDELVEFSGLGKICGEVTATVSNLTYIIIANTVK